MKKFVISIILIALCSGLCSCILEKPVCYIFEDISECENIEKLKSEDAVVTVYDSPDSDKNLGDLQYDSFYCASYESKDFDFEIFAYDFVDSDFAKEYYNRETKLGCDFDVTFHTSKGMSLYDIIVLDYDKVYIAKSSAKDSDDLNSFLNKVFSKKIENKNPDNVE